MPAVGGEVVGVFEAIGPGALSAVEGLPVSVGNCICIPVAVLSSWLRRRTLAGSVRVGAAGALYGSGALSEAEWVEGARCSCASGMPSPSLSPAQDF